MEEDIIKNLSETYSDIPFSLKDKIDQFEESGLLFNKDFSLYKFFRTEISQDQPDEKISQMKLSDILITNKIQKKIQKFGEIDKIKEEDSIGENSQDFKSRKNSNKSANLKICQSYFHKKQDNSSMKYSLITFENDKDASRFLKQQQSFNQKNSSYFNDDISLQNNTLSENKDQLQQKLHQKKNLKICDVVKFSIQSKTQSKQTSVNFENSDLNVKNQINQNRRETLKIFKNQHLKKTANLLKKLQQKKKDSFEIPKKRIKKSTSIKKSKHKKIFQKSFDQYYQRGSNISKRFQSSAELKKYKSPIKNFQLNRSKDIFAKAVETKDSSKYQTQDFLDDSQQVNKAKKTFCCIKKKFLKNTHVQKNKKKKNQTIFLKNPHRKARKQIVKDLQLSQERILHV